MGTSWQGSGQEKHRSGMPTGDAQTGRATKTAAGRRPNLLGGRPEDAEDSEIWTWILRREGAAGQPRWHCVGVQPDREWDEMRDRIVTKLLERAEEADRLRRSKRQPAEAQRRRTRQSHDEEPEGQPELRRRRVHNAEGDRPAQSTEDRANQCVTYHGGKIYVMRLTASAGKRTAPTRQLALKRVRVVLGDLSVVIAAGEAAPTRTPLAEIPTPRRAHPRRRTAAKRKADELEQIENRPSGLVNRTVRDAARAETFA